LEEKLKLKFNSKKNLETSCVRININDKNFILQSSHEKFNSKMSNFVILYKKYETENLNLKKNYNLEKKKISELLNVFKNFFEEKTIFLNKKINEMEEKIKKKINLFQQELVLIKKIFKKNKRKIYEDYEENIFKIKKKMKRTNKNENSFDFSKIKFFDNIDKNNLLSKNNLGIYYKFRDTIYLTSYITQKDNLFLQNFFQKFKIKVSKNFINNLIFET
jgi:hypothetical protein